MKQLALFLLGVALLWSGGLRAQKCAVVETTSGERMEYLLSDLPRIVYSDAKVVLTTNKTVVNFNPQEVKKIYLGESTTDISDVKGPDGTLKMQDNMLSLSGYTANEAVVLYTIDGRQLWQEHVDAQGRLTISLSQLPAGIYIIKTNNQSVKITKK